VGRALRHRQWIDLGSGGNGAQVQPCGLGLLDRQRLGVIRPLARTTGTACRTLAALLIATGLCCFCFLPSRLDLFVPLSGLGSSSFCFQFGLPLRGSLRLGACCA
jgi:hypothetical protein